MAPGVRRPAPEREALVEHPSLGEQEMDLLQYVTENAPVSVRQAAEGFGQPRGLARTTVLTVLERLRRKGYLARARRRGVYRYSPRMPQEEVLRGLVQEFVRSTLRGSLAPVVAYLAQARELTEAEVEELDRLVAELKGRAKEGPP
jgi:predicted transcriptional regulator